MRRILLSACALTTFFVTAPVFAAPASATRVAAPANACAALPSHDALAAALKGAQGQKNGGLGNNMWGVVVDRTGTTCAVVITGAGAGDQWPGSRLIAAAKANTANAFSLDGFALSTANLYSAAQPGGFLFGIQANNPTNPAVAFKGPATAFGTNSDPLVGEMAGGSNVFGGGLPLYNAAGKIIGGLGVSGDTSCADHNIAWRTRSALKLDYVGNGPSSNKNDQIIYDISLGKSAGGFGQPECGGKEATMVATLPPTEKTASTATPAQ